MGPAPVADALTNLFGPPDGDRSCRVWSEMRVSGADPRTRSDDCAIDDGDAVSLTALLSRCRRALNVRSFADERREVVRSADVSSASGCTPRQSRRAHR